MLTGGDGPLLVRDGPSFEKVDPTVGNVRW